MVILSHRVSLMFDVLHTVINSVRVQTLPTSVLTDFFSRGHDPFAHACEARPLTIVGRTSLNVSVSVAALLVLSGHTSLGSGSPEGGTITPNLTSETKHALACGKALASLERRYRLLVELSNVRNCLTNAVVGFLGSLMVLIVAERFSTCMPLVTWDLRGQEDVDGFLREQAVEAAADACHWRMRICTSLASWDALVCAALPMAKHEARVRRLCKLLSVLWPREADVDTSADQGRELDALLGTCLAHLASVSHEGMLALLRDLQQASSKLSRVNQKSMEELVASSSLCTTKEQLGELRQGVRAWFNDLRNGYWQPLKGPARALFCKAFSASGLAPMLEKCLVGTGGLIAESLKPLANGNSKEKVFGVGCWKT